MHWTEDYRVVARNGGDQSIDFVHVPSGRVLLNTVGVSMETLNGLMREFDTFGEIRSNWRAWWDENPREPRQ